MSAREHADGRYSSAVYEARNAHRRRGPARASTHLHVRLHSVPSVRCTTTAPSLIACVAHPRSSMAPSSDAALVSMCWYCPWTFSLTPHRSRHMAAAHPDKDRLTPTPGWRDASSGPPASAVSRTDGKDNGDRADQGSSSSSSGSTSELSQKGASSLFLMATRRRCPTLLPHGLRASAVATARTGAQLLAGRRG